MDIFAQEWKSRLADSTRAVFYRNVVSDCKFSALLDVVNIKSHRIALTRLIASSHRLRVETGRWVRPPIPRDERLCPICNKQEDEYHIIFECRRFSDLRKKLIPAYYLRNISMFKCNLHVKTVQIFSDDHKKTVRNLIFIQQSPFIWHSKKLYKPPCFVIFPMTDICVVVMYVLFDFLRL